MSLSEEFRALHHRGTPFIIPNPWDVGSALLLQSIGFEALATTSSGHAASLGRRDSTVTKAEALAHAEELSAAATVPVSGDFEHGWSNSPEGVAQTITDAASAGLAGCSIEDYEPGADVYEFSLAVERVQAAVEAAKPTGFVITARAENLIRGHQDMDDTIARLQAFSAAGADCVYAPGVRSAEQIKTVTDAVDAPLNVLAAPGVPTVPEMAELGVARISVGGGFARVAYGAAIAAGQEMLEQGTTSWWDDAATWETLGHAFDRRR